jgi:hypothetical protein
MIFFINGLQWTGYKKMSFTSVGESACADSWGKALKTGEPALTIPVLRRAAVRAAWPTTRLLMAIPPRLPAEGDRGAGGPVEERTPLSHPALRIQSDAAAGLSVSYADKDKR